jgi:hypothetical protein
MLHGGRNGHTANDIIVQAMELRFSKAHVHNAIKGN